MVARLISAYKDKIKNEVKKCGSLQSGGTRLCSEVYDLTSLRKLIMF